QRWQPAYSGSLFLEARLLRRSGELKAALAQLVKARDAAGECWQPRQQAQRSRGADATRAWGKAAGDGVRSERGERVERAGGVAD
ncbi:MAG: hypothetical protein AAGL49_09835, partial [Pseudomonadota bacterium]